MRYGSYIAGPYALHLEELPDDSDVALRSNSAALRGGSGLVPTSEPPQQRVWRKDMHTHAETSRSRLAVLSTYY